MPRPHALTLEQKVTLITTLMLDPEVAHVVVEQCLLAVQRYLREGGLGVAT